MAAEPHGPTVSAVLIVKDEEDVLDACLASVAWTDQVVVYDTGSADRTRDIALARGARVIEGFWDDDFGAARNRSLEHATSEWVLTIDADETFVGDPGRFRDELAGHASGTRTIVQANDRAVAAGPDQDAEVMRVFRRSGYRWSGALHEQLVAVGAAHAPQAVPVRTAHLAHVGYRDEMLVAKDKPGRNVVLAERQLAAATTSGAGLPLARFNLVRSLALAGATDRALELGAAMWRAGDLRDPLVGREIAGLMTVLADDADRPDAARMWRERWTRLAPERAWAHRARTAAGRGDAAAVLDAVRHLPPGAPRGRDRAGRAHLAREEVWALARTDRWDEAADVALAAARAGLVPADPKDLVLVHRAVGRPLDAVLGALSDESWQALAILATQERAPAADTLLTAMLEHRPGDVTVLTCAAGRAGLMTLDEAMRWSVPVRAAGLLELCPLRAVAATTGLDPRQRALAAAVAVEAYQDHAVLADLEDALSRVPAEHEAELAVLIEAVAPGLLAPQA